LELIKIIFIKTCENCGTKFQTSKKNQKFCSDKCRTYFRKKINIIVVPKPIKIRTQQFGRRRRTHKPPPHIINDTKRTIKKIKKSRKD